MDRKRVSHRSRGLYLSRRHTAAYCSLGLIICGLVFTSGYFVGKQHGIEGLIEHVEYDTLANHVTSALLTDYTVHFDEAVQAQVEQELCKQEAPVELFGEDEKSEPHYYAQIVGYGTKAAAERFIEKLKEKDIPVCLKERQSKTAQGKERSWYQVVTKPFNDQETLKEVTQRIAREENVTGIQIISC